MDRHTSLFSSQIPTSRSNPEDFYRSSNPQHLPPIDPHLYKDPNGVSPTDSHASIMQRSDSTAPSAYDYPVPPGTATSTPPPPPPVFIPPSNQDAYYPSPPPMPAVNNYRTSMGVVNGEVGATVAPYTPVSPVSPSRDGEFRFPAAPLSAGLKTPGTAKEEARVQELEEKAILEDRKDLAIKLKVRLAKVVLRSINCACSLVVLALVSSTFAIFFATRNLAPRNNFRPWAVDTPQWPQIVILVIACISLILSFGIMYGYWKGGHSRAERMALRATIFAGGVFIFTIVIWSIGIGVMQGSRDNNDDKDMWGWSCKDNMRKKLYQDTINYDLVCRQQDWVVVCAIIEIGVETLAIAVYLFAFYRLFYTKRRLRKSLQIRDEARSSLWLAKLQEQRDLEEGQPDAETAKNTAYNQLHSKTAYASPPVDGHVVPILQAPPPKKNNSAMSSPALPQTEQQPQMTTTMRESVRDVPPSARSVSFQMPPPPPFVRPSSRE
ncbi:hypothetical protein EX30DRAFT_342817 [Ascodesmis nigricans]|uniref:MARVEL domain-containing protein n=1 Tax=Ascodesmis nigricans TaxID=341454 RepID=A0A4S2MP79_9PEZI|nr:hypothetical protein EX30DRAFT_342817 [Ascodesmis nigricans]